LATRTCLQLWVKVTKSGKAPTETNQLQWELRKVRIYYLSSLT
jgi:hypothetical protein